jgi:16S rRNA (guanine1207-N2)-methyltransferase
MSDRVTNWLMNEISHGTDDNSVWFSDENILREISTVAELKKKPILITNRWDIAQHAEVLGIQTEFSDFDCQHIADHSQDRVFYRISKEKPIVHHLINQAFRILKPHGELIIAGQKTEGIKTYIEKARKLFSSDARIHKESANYHARISKNTAIHSESNFLDDSDYTRIRVIAELRGHPLYSKPGIFGWNKVDQGSALLVEQLNAFLPTLKQQPDNLLDLGCGYGYLTLMTADLPCTHRTLTDNNAAALALARFNCADRGIPADIIAGDAGSYVTRLFIKDLM